MTEPSQHHVRRWLRHIWPGALGVVGDLDPVPGLCAWLQPDEVLSAQQTAFNRAQIGKVLPVLVERAGRVSGQMHGRSPYLQSVHFEAPAHVMGRIVDVRIEGASQNALSGVLMQKAAA